MFGCNESAVYIPIQECDACDSFESRLEKIEEFLDGKTNVEISGMDVNGNKVTLQVIGDVS